MSTRLSDRPVISRWLLLLTAMGITYGSLYPFNFAPTPVSLERILTILLSDWQDALRLPNIFANIVLFVPYGLFGIFAFPSLTARKRWLTILSSAAILAFGIQIIQVWFSGRVPTAVDGVINMSGAIIGMGLAWFPPIRTILSGFNTRKRDVYAVPLLLLLSWLAYRWFPFVPSLDVFVLKQGLKPLLLDPEWRPLNFIHNLTAWLLFATLWRHCRFRDTLLWVVIPGSLCVQFFIADNAILLHNVLAAFIAPPLWFALYRTLKRPEAPITLLLIATLLLMGLSPFETAPPSSFKWIPFAGFLTGNMMINTASLLEKLFLYGSLVWLILSMSRNKCAALLVPLMITGGIEVAQVWLAGRGAEITDPVLCLMLWWLILTEQKATAVPTRSTPAQIQAEPHLEGSLKPD